MKFQKLTIRDYIKRSAILLCGLVFIASGSSVAAQSFTDKDLKSIKDTTQWYGPDLDGCENTGGGDATDNEPLTGSDNIEQAYNFFRVRGLTAEQSAGIVGNLMQESGVNPKSHQNGGGPGRGIAQWSVNERWAQLIQHEKGKDPYALATQLDFLWYEMSEVAPWNQSLPAVKATNSFDDVVQPNGSRKDGSTRAFEETFEKAGKPNMPQRIKYARQVYNKYGLGDSIGTDAPPADTPIESCPGAGNGTGNSEFIDGFTIYYQCDPAWANAPFGPTKVCPSGCGPSAMAMIITALTGQRVTPDQTAAYAGSKGMYVSGVGSSHAIPQVVGDHWGVKATHVGKDVAKINQALQSGGLVIGSGKGPLPFTSGGHYIVIRAVTADGKWKVGDSAHKATNTASYDPAKLLSSMPDSSIYIVTK